MTMNLDEAFLRFIPEDRFEKAKMLKAAICEETIRRCVGEHGERLRAIVLTGSLARDEPTFIKDGRQWSLLGDADFLLVFSEKFRLASSVECDMFCRRIEKELLQQNISSHISIGVVQANFFRQLQPCIFTYELMAYGQVIWGDTQILSLIRAFSVTEIPLEDAWRLLCNRMIELLEVAGKVVEKPAILPPLVYYQTMKLYLDMATSYLVFVGAYEPTYRERGKAIRLLADNANLGKADPFPLEDFAERVETCTRMKLLGLNDGDLQVISGEKGSTITLLEEAVTFARLLWRWELMHLTAAVGEEPDGVLMKKWMQRQPFPTKIRGWCSVLRVRGWSSDWRDWPRWAQHGRRTSPRYLVYGIASELFFCLPRVLAPGGALQESDSYWESLRLGLPVIRSGTATRGWSKWHQLVAEVVWNYHEFLERTRA